jgi:hypothetical protein
VVFHENKRTQAHFGNNDQINGVGVWGMAQTPPDLGQPGVPLRAWITGLLLKTALLPREMC